MSDVELENSKGLQPQLTTESKTDTIAEIGRTLGNPLRNLTDAEVSQNVDQFCTEYGLSDHVEVFQKGAMLAKYPKSFEALPHLSETDKAAIRRERSHKWSQPFLMYYLIFIVSMCAIVLGMDEAVVNGAQLEFSKQFDINSKQRTDRGRPAGNADWLLGTVNASPFIACSLVGCWLTEPLNRWLGRRGCIFLAVSVTGIASIWEAVVNSWQNLLAARIILGVGLGPLTSCVPVYAAETAPPNIRGSLVMFWQIWTAFGVAVGYAVSIAFYFVPDKPHITGLNWRLMLGSTVVGPIVVCANIFFCPESPRWLIGKSRYREAYNSLLRTRNTPLQAARDLYYMQLLIKEEEKGATGGWGFCKLFTVPRNRRATLAATIAMFMQQFCGINVIAYYSSQIFLDAGFSIVPALAASLGFGLINWVFALPAFLTIDSFGRRGLLLTTFPLMGIFLLFTGLCFLIPEGHAKIGCVALGIYLHCAVYSSGEGPIPFTYSAECFPLSVRNLGMSWATAVCWFFNAVLALTWPKMKSSLTPTGAFGFYAGMNFVGFFLVLFFMPETKAYSLEELDQIFSVPTWKHARYHLGTVPFTFKKYILRQSVDRKPLYNFDEQHQYIADDDTKSLEEKSSP